MGILFFRRYVRQVIYRYLDCGILKTALPGCDVRMARCCGFCSNVARGKRKKTDADDKIPCFLEPQLNGRLSGEIEHD